MEQTYIDIMIQSLNKKIKVLDEIMELNMLQKSQLENDKTPIEEFDTTVEQKSKCIEQLDLLDSGFDKLYGRVAVELKAHKSDYTEQIKAMQNCIRQITDKSMEIQAQEARNKELMTRKFAFVKESARNVRTSSKVATQYYKNMMQLNYVAPQFMDNKK